MKIIVQTDRGATVTSLDLSDRMPGGHIANSVWRAGHGRSPMNTYDAMLRVLRRAQLTSTDLSDEQLVNLALDATAALEVRLTAAGAAGDMLDLCVSADAALQRLDIGVRRRDPASILASAA